MSNSFHSVIIDTSTGNIILRLHLNQYLTPSLNTILSSHWSNLHKHKQKAKDALISALKESAPNCKITITSSEAQNLLPINYDTLVSSLMMTHPQSKATTHNKSVKKSKTKKPSSKSLTSQPHKNLAQPHK